MSSDGMAGVKAKRRYTTSAWREEGVIHIPTIAPQRHSRDAGERCNPRRLAAARAFTHIHGPSLARIVSRHHVLTGRAQMSNITVAPVAPTAVIRSTRSQVDSRLAARPRVRFARKRLHHLV